MVSLGGYLKLGRQLTDLSIGNSRETVARKFERVAARSRNLTLLTVPPRDLRTQPHPARGLTHAHPRPDAVRTDAMLGVGPPSAATATSNGDMSEHLDRHASGPAADAGASANSLAGHDPEPAAALAKIPWAARPAGQPPGPVRSRDTPLAGTTQRLLPRCAVIANYFALIVTGDDAPTLHNAMPITAAETAASAAAAAAAAAAGTQHAGVTGASCARRGMDLVALQAAAANEVDPFVPRPLTRGTKIAMTVQASNVVLLIVALIWGHIAFGQGEMKARLQLSVVWIIAMSICFAGAVAQRLYGRGAVAWLFRRAYAEAPPAALAFHNKVLNSLALNMAVTGAAFGLAGPPLTQLFFTHDALSDRWWGFSAAQVIPVFIAGGFGMATVPVMSMTLGVKELLKARLAWLRAARPPRVRAAAVYFEMENVLDVMSKETTPVMVLLCGIGSLNVTLYTLFTVAEETVLWYMVASLLGCGGMAAFSIVCWAQVSMACDDFTNQWLLIFDSLDPGRLEDDTGADAYADADAEAGGAGAHLDGGEAKAVSQPATTPGGTAMGAGCPLTFEGLEMYMSAWPLGVRVGKTRVYYSKDLEFTKVIGVWVGALVVFSRVIAVET